MTFQEYLLAKDACKESQIWAANKTSTEAWNKCDNVHWLTWWVRHENSTTITREVWVQFAARCADIVAPLKSIEAASETANAAWAATWAADARYAARYAVRAAVRAADGSNFYYKQLLDLVRSTFEQPWKEF